MTATRYLTLLWPGLPWLWLRGSMAGLVLAIAFGAVLDVSMLLTWVWAELATREFVLGLWVATAGVWAVATLSAVTTFPPPLPSGRDEGAEKLFVAARDAYLCRDWLTAETTLRSLLVVAPTDGEAQLLLATLLRRAGRAAESRQALERLARADAGRPWLAVIRRELRRIEATAAAGAVAGAERGDDPGREGPVVLPLAAGTPARAGGTDRAARAA